MNKYLLVITDLSYRTHIAIIENKFFECPYVKINNLTVLSLLINHSYSLK